MSKPNAAQRLAADLAVITEINKRRDVRAPRAAEDVATQIANDENVSRHEVR